jgi:Raf kinase inhibitor-like YbhB/YbcL family protein
MLPYRFGILAILFLAALLSAPVSGRAQQSVTGAVPEFSKGAVLQVGSDDFRANAPISDRFSGYGAGLSPALHWSAVPNAKSYMVIVEDPDARPVTVVHWLMWNIPGSVVSLGQGIAQNLRLSDPANAMQGQNSHKTIGYTGPHPPAGDPAHHYHFQVFALDSLIQVDPGATRDEVIAAATGHVVAHGEIIGLYGHSSPDHK